MPHSLRAKKKQMPVFWMTGLPGSGKTTVGSRLVARLKVRGQKSILLDGDAIREGLCADLGFSDSDRFENIRRIAWLAKLFQGEGYLVVVATISPSARHRALARSIVGDGFQEVFISSPVEVCARRDPKGMYAGAREGKISGFTGISATYEVPADPQLKLETASSSLEESVAEALHFLDEWIGGEQKLRKESQLEFH